MTKPPLTTTNKPLHFSDLEPLEFERLCLWLIDREGYLRPQHLGEAGTEQGRDIVAYKRTGDGEELWYFQCKRCDRIGTAKLKEEVDKYDRLAAIRHDLRPTGIVFVTSAVLSAKVRDAVGAYCREHGYAYDFWARTELDMRVKKYPDVIAEFFAANRAPLATALHQLPPPPRDFVGRAEELAELTTKVGERGVTISSLHGIGGIGKTALALKLAAQLTPLYPEAQFYLDLKGASEQHPLSVTEALAHVIRAYHSTTKLPDNEAELRALYQSVLHKQRALLLMDNARDAAQVAPLIPPDGCFLLITSRQHFTLPGLYAKDLDTLPPGDASELLRAIAPRIGAQADRIAKLCGYLPLALRLAASAVIERKDLDVDKYVRRLMDARQLLKLLHDVDVSLGLSYELLSDELQQRWRALAVFPSTFNAEAAAYVWQIDLDGAQDTLSDLVRYSLVDWNEASARYSLHDLARTFADNRLGAEERQSGQALYASYYCDVLRKANDLYLQGGDALMHGLSLFDLEWTNIQAGQLWAARHSGENDSAAHLCTMYPDAGVFLLLLRQHPRERISWLEATLAVARHFKDRAEEGTTLGNLGIAYIDLGEGSQAIELFEQALAIAQEICDHENECRWLGNLGRAYNRLGKFGRAIEFLERALAIAQQLQDQRAVASMLVNLGNTYRRLAKAEHAIELFNHALAIAQEIGDRLIEGGCFGNLGHAYVDIGKLHQALEHYERHLLITREMHDRRNEAKTLQGISVALYKLDRHTEAITHAEEALEILRQLEDSDAEELCLILNEWKS